MKEVVSNKKIGLIAGYEPNRISLYIMLLECGRIEYLREALWKDIICLTLNH
jgi:hypothetical protein